MAKKSSIRWIPFAKNGDLIEYSSYTQDQLDDFQTRVDASKKDYGAVDWRQIYEFTDTLTFQGFSFGRSAMRARYKDSNGVEYAMFISEFERLMLADRIYGTVVHGKWTFAKRGTNYGLIEAQQ